MLRDRSNCLVPELDLLSEASLLLLSDGDPHAVLRAVVALCADRMNCYAAVYTPSPGTGSATAAGQPEHVASLDTLPHESVAQAAARLGLAHTHLEPLVDGNRSLGLLLLAMTDRGAMDDVACRVVRTIGTICGVAIVRAESNAARQRIVDRLQRALLPTRLPEVEGLGLDAAYRPATNESDVGGDWYDAFDLDDGRIGISIGDVVGHGLDAAVTMGEARRAIRMAASAIESPSDLLDHANSVLRTEDGTMMATAIAGFYDIATGVFTYSCAGHPAPIFQIGRGTHALPGGGLPLGLGPHIGSPNWTITLAAESSIYFYTDGLLEYHRDIIAGERRLLQVIEQTSIACPENAAIALHDAVFDGIENTDDAATLVLRSRAQTTRTLSVTYSAMPAFAAVFRSVLRTFISSLDVAQETADAILYATGEAVANAIEHGARDATDQFRVDLDADDDRLNVVVESPGHWKAFVDQRERGRGIPLMQALATQVRVASAQNATRVHLTFALTAT